MIHLFRALESWTFQRSSFWGSGSSPENHNKPKKNVIGSSRYKVFLVPQEASRLVQSLIVHLRVARSSRIFSGSAIFLLQGVSKSVQVLSNGIEAVMVLVLILIILKQRALFLSFSGLECCCTYYGHISLIYLKL